MIVLEVLSLSRHCRQKCDIRAISDETALQFAEELALNGETYGVSVNEFSATCNWQVVGVQVEQNRCKDRALRKAVTLGSPSTVVIAHVHPETSISKKQTHQSGEPVWHAFTQFVKKISVPDSVICCCYHHHHHHRRFCVHLQR